MLTFQRAGVAVVSGALVLGGAALMITADGADGPATELTTATEPAATITVKLRKAIKDRPVANERRSGYSRSTFPTGIDADRDCQDTRSEVLRQESKRAVTGACAVKTGKWRSYYDGKTWTKAYDVDVSHTVALAEAWDSSARLWSRDRRQAYANDLGDSRTLVVVTDNVNLAKGARDPARWLPAKGRCRYVASWIAVKIRWSLKVDRGEKNALTRVAKGCDNVTLRVTRWAPPTSPPPVPTPTPALPTVTPAPPSPTPTVTSPPVPPTTTPTP